MESTHETLAPEQTTNGKGPGASTVGRQAIVLIVIAVLVAASIDLYALMKVWPHPTPSGAPAPAGAAKGDTARKRDTTTKRDTTGKRDTTRTPDTSKTGSLTAVRGVPGALTCDTTVVPRAYALSPSDSMKDPECVSIGGRAFPIWAEQRLLLIVILCGFLGGLVHTIRSLGWYIGNRWLVRSWLPFYALLPVTGAMIAVAFYLVIRGGFFSPSGSFRDTSPFGFAAMSVLVGMFSTPAALKLQQLAETMLTKPGAGADSKPQSTSTSDGAKPSGNTPPATDDKHPANEQGGLPRAGASPAKPQG
jgi:hypothetical protein